MQRLNPTQTEEPAPACARGSGASLPVGQRNPDDDLVGVGSRKAVVVDLFGALSHPPREAQRLLDLGQDWPSSPKPAETAPPALLRPTRTARQLAAPDLGRLVSTYRDGATVYELARQFGIHRTTVGKHLRARGVDTTPPGLAPGDVPTAAELYRHGWSLARIAERYDTTANTVRTRLLEVDVRMRGPWEGASH